jgi:hypothetical protein
VSYVSSDFHCRGGRTWAAETLEALEARGGAEAAEILELNGRRLLDGLDPLPVPPLPVKTGFLGRLRRLVG